MNLNKRKVSGLLLSILFACFLWLPSLWAEGGENELLTLHRWKEGGVVCKIPSSLTIEREDSEVLQASSDSVYFFIGRIGNKKANFETTAEKYWQTFQEKGAVLKDDDRDTINGYSARILGGLLDDYKDPVVIAVVGIRNPAGNDYLLSIMFRGMKEPDEKTKNILRDVLHSFSIIL